MMGTALWPHRAREANMRGVARVASKRRAQAITMHRRLEVVAPFVVLAQVETFGLDLWHDTQTNHGLGQL